MVVRMFAMAGLIFWPGLWYQDHMNRSRIGLDLTLAVSRTRKQ